MILQSVQFSWWLKSWAEGSSWHWAMLLWGRADPGKTKLLFYTLQCVYFCTFAQKRYCHLSTGLPGFHRGIPVYGWLSGLTFLWRYEGWNVFSAILMTSHLYFPAANLMCLSPPTRLRITGIKRLLVLSIFIWAQGGKHVAFSLNTSCEKCGCSDSRFLRRI